MRLLIAIALSFAISYSAAAATVKVVDAVDNDPVPGAAVFTASGAIIGMTDDKGEIEISDARAWPILIRCLGYEPATGDSYRSTVSLQPETYQLHEVVVTPVDRPVARILCYFREYISVATASDTITYFNEHMGDFFTTETKVKGFKAPRSPRFVLSSLHARKSDNKGLDSIFRPDYRDDTFAWEGMLQMPRGRVDINERIAAGANADTIAGKYGIKSLIRKNGAILSTRTDLLADSKNHVMSPFIFKMLGLTIDFTEVQGAWIVNIGDRNTYAASDVISGTFSLKAIAKGKWFKKAFETDSPVEVYTYYEIYPVDVEHLTAEEAKEMLDTKPSGVRMQRSPLAPPLSPACQRMVDYFAKQPI